VFFPCKSGYPGNLSLWRHPAGEVPGLLGGDRLLLPLVRRLHLSYWSSLSPPSLWDYALGVEVSGGEEKGRSSSAQAVHCRWTSG
jgi:hypothetical protein